MIAQVYVSMSGVCAAPVVRMWLCVCLFLWHAMGKGEAEAHHVFSLDDDFCLKGISLCRTEAIRNENVP